MVTALTELCHRVLPGMQERGWGCIVNKILAGSMRPLPVSLQYHLGNRLNPFKEG